MIPQLGFGETLVIVLLAIIVVGPKDLPALMNKIGRAIARIKMMGREFQDAFNEMGAESEIAELRKEIEDLKNLGPEDKEFLSEMTALDTELRDGADISKPK